MARTKTYRSKLYAKYSTRIPKGDGVVTLEFISGFRVGGTLNGGMLTTSDESLQEAIEATEKYKRGDIYCSYDSGNVADEATAKTVEPIKHPITPILPKAPEVPETPKLPIEPEKTKAETPIAPIAPTPNIPTIKVVETVKTRQEARMYFRDAGEQGMTPTLSFDTVSKLALKYNVQFPNLK